MATTFVAGTSQATTPETHLMRDVSMILSKHEPDIVPIDTLLRRMPKGEAAKQDKIEWAQVGMWPRQDTVTSESAAGSAGDTVNVPVDTPGNWRIHDTILIPSDLTAPMLRVEAVNASTLTVRALGEYSNTNATGNGTVPLIPAGAIIAWTGNALPEKGGPSTSRAVMPEYAYNFCELHDVIVDVSGTRKATKNYTNQHDWARSRAEQLREFRLSTEYKLLFGKISRTLSGGLPIWTMNGIVRYIENTLTYDKNASGVKLSETQIIDWLVRVFSGNSGSQTRFLFADSYLAGEINKVPLSSLRSRELTQVLGVKCEKMIFNFGTVYVKHHRGLNELGFDHYGLLLDMEQIRKRDLQPMERVPLALKTQGKNMDAEQYIEQSSVEVRYPATHAIIQGV
jgi:hypothetical protein